MDSSDNPHPFEPGQSKPSLEATYLGDKPFPDADDDSKMKLAGELVQACCLLHAGRRVADEIVGGVEVAAATQEAGDR